jgi:hypothetical protein
VWRIPERRQSLADKFFVRIRPIDFGGVEEGHAFFDGGPDQRDACFFVDSWAIAKAQTHTPKAEGGDFQPTCSEFTFLH